MSVVVRDVGFRVGWTALLSEGLRNRFAPPIPGGLFTSTPPPRTPLLLLLLLLACEPACLSEAEPCFDGLFPPPHPVSHGAPGVCIYHRCA